MSSQAGISQHKSEISLETNQEENLCQRKSATISIKQVIDAIPCLFAIINFKNGKILRGSAQLAQLQGLTQNELHDQSLKDIFQPQTWDKFLQKVAEALGIRCGENAKAPRTQKPFVLAIDGLSQTPAHSYAWQLGALHGDDDLVSVIGTPFAEAPHRRDDRALQLFTRAPAGIILVGKQLRIHGPTNIFLQDLFDQTSLAGQSLLDLLVAPGRTRISPREQKTLEDLPDVIGSSDIFFEAIQAQLPNKILFSKFSNEDLAEELAIDISYTPIIENSLVQGLMLILQPGELIQEIEPQADPKSEQDFRLAQRYIEIYRIQPTMRRVIIHDLEQGIKKFSHAYVHGDRRGYAQALHGIKGIARICQLSKMSEFAESLEESMSKHAPSQSISPNNNPDWLRQPSLHHSIFTEWQEIEKISQCLDARYEGFLFKDSD